MGLFDEIGWVEISISKEDIAHDGERISKSVMENEAYEVTEDFMTGTYTVRMGNPVLPCSVMGVEELKQDLQMEEKKRMWRRLRQVICWLFKGRNMNACYLTVRMSHPKEVICGGCRHNMWEKWDK